MTDENESEAIASFRKQSAQLLTSTPEVTMDLLMDLAEALEKKDVCLAAIMAVIALAMKLDYNKDLETRKLKIATSETICVKLLKVLGKEFKNVEDLPPHMSASIDLFLTSLEKLEKVETVM